MITRTLQDVTITIKDGASHSLVLTGDGEFRCTIQRGHVPISHRGVLDRWAYTGEVPILLEFAIQVEYMSYPVTYPTLYDAFWKRTGAASWTSTATDGNVYTLEVEVLVNNPAPSGFNERLNFEYVVCDSCEFWEADTGNMLYFRGRDLEATPLIEWPT